MSIRSDDDLVEAVDFFGAGDDAPLSSAASILSGRSFSSRRITMRVEVNMEYEGPSLSDTSSLASFDEFKGRNTSQHSFSITAPHAEPEDDSITVSSKDFGLNSLRRTPPSQGSNPFDGDNDTSSPESFTSAIPPYKNKQSRRPDSTQGSGETLECASDRFAPPNGSLVSDAVNRYPEDPSAVFEHLKLQEDMSDSSSVHRGIGGNARGQAWLRDQEARVIFSKVGRVPQPSESDDASLSLDDGLGGDLALERNTRGSYYYTYTTSSQGHDEGPRQSYDAATSENGVPHGLQPRPSSMHLNWLASQQANLRREPRPSASVPSLNTHHSDPLPGRTNQFPDDPFTYESNELAFLPLSEPPEGILTDCSSCGSMLNTIRYVCSTCGEKGPKQRITATKGKGRETIDSKGNRHIPMDNLCFSSSPTMVGSSESLSQQQQRPLPPLPSISSFPSIFGLRRPSGSSAPTQMPQPPRLPIIVGFELCPNCIETAGVDHAILAAAPAPAGPSSPEDPQQALQWRKAPPKKGHLRHAYHEKLWGQRGWENVGMYQASP